ncbi:MAG: hypothetical protein ACI9LM_003444 [Alteromonadaceae bacterium]|jgi:hypothetical protein
MNRYLMVPIQLDALYVEGDELSVVEQVANYPVLPYIERTFKEEFNGDTANISESIVSQPFQNKNLRLGHGIHLHWSLPDALTRGDENLNFPEVPDRWLVTRRRKNDAGEFMVEKQWIVESNYLFPPNINKKGSAVSIPYVSNAWCYNSQTKEYEYKPDDQQTPMDERANQPYRYMGRKMPLSAWQQIFQEEYYPSLTTIGYGEPTFAAFYPNSFSVFGFHDSNPGDDLTTLQYEVVGWYGDESKDVISSLIKENPQLTDQLSLEEALDPDLIDDMDESLINQTNNNLASDTENDIRAAIQEKYNWKISVSEQHAPEGLLCYAGLNFSSSSQNTVINKDGNTSVTFANTSTEALSACLAEQLAEGDQKYLKSVEDQLEAMQLAFRLDEKKLDSIARFKELRHENSFTPVSSGHRWIIRSESQSETSGKNKSNVPDLSDEILICLNEINTLQQEYHHAWHNIESLKKQLFADWYKYMICMYPPESIQDYPSADLVKHFIERKVILPLKNEIYRVGELVTFKKDENGNITEIKESDESGALSIAKRLAEKLNNLILNIEQEEAQINATVNDGNSVSYNYFIEQIPEPRFWEPNDPVVLIEGDIATSTQRHGKDSTLECSVFNHNIFEGKNNFTRITELVHAKLSLDKQGLNTWDNQPWNPFLLEWQTQLFANESGSNHSLEHGAYTQTFITDNFEAPILNPDLVLKKGKGKIVNKGNIYSGHSILSPQANDILKYNIENRLINNLELFENAQQIRLSNYTGSKSLDNPVYTLILAYEKLLNLNVLSQSLNGFNEALLMHKQTMELSIDDPLGFENYAQFSSETVDEAMDGDVKIAPSPLNSFNPIRSGCLKVLRLRLVDTFGQTKDIDIDKIDTTYKMTTPKSKYLIKLAPRLMQPARLNFRWLNAKDNLVESDFEKASTPICGWLLTNSFDQSVMFYDADGKALGYFKADLWREAIDSDAAISLAEIANPHLKRVANYIKDSIDLDDNFIEHFIGTLDDAMANIQPENNTCKGAALLIGKPVAVVRASLNLELSGTPAVNQDWNAFRKDMAKNQRSTDEFTKVQFPVRLGEYGQLNDGLIGYWLEKQDLQGQIHFATEALDSTGTIVFEKGNKFYSPQSDYIDAKTIESRFEYLSDGAINFYQSIDDKSQTVTMLMNAQGVIHATVGILPNKEISIPQDQYTQALQNIEVTFLHAPLLTRQGKIDMPLRKVNDYLWSWVEQNNAGGWHELFPENRIDKNIFVDQWDALSQTTTGEQLWAYLHHNEVNWLRNIIDENNVVNSEIAKILPIDDRKKVVFDGLFLEKEQLIESVLDKHSSGLDPVSTEAIFTGEQELKEGWLKLRKPDKADT